MLEDALIEASRLQREAIERIQRRVAASQGGNLDQSNHDAELVHGAFQGGAVPTSFPP